jgi:seryl-tRNA synthetase
VDRQVLEYQFQLHRDSIANAQRIEDLAQKQQKLEAEAKAIASRSGALDKRESELKEQVQKAKADIRRIKNNERFAKWLDNSCWALERWGKGTAKGVGRWIRWMLDEVEWQSGKTQTIAIVIAGHWLILFPLFGAMGLRVALSDRCLQIEPCRAVLRWAINSEQARPKPHKKEKTP